jgi:cytochrome c oxidase subunit IV
MQQQPGPYPRAQLWPLLRCWLLLLVLGGIEIALSYLPLARSLRPLLMVPAGLMVIVVAVGFMEVKRGSVLLRAFALGALFWLLILLGLGSVDPMTRTDYPVRGVQVK